MDMMTQWEEQLEKAKDALEMIKLKEQTWKDRRKLDENSLKLSKRMLHKATRIRLGLQKEIKLFWKRKKAKMAYRRKWARENPGKTVVLR